MDKFKEIRPVVLGIAMDKNKILVSEGYDKIKKQTFYRIIPSCVREIELCKLAFPTVTIIPNTARFIKQLTTILNATCESIWPHK